MDTGRSSKCVENKKGESGQKRTKVLTVGDILWWDGIEQLGTNGYAKVCEVAQKLTSQAQTLVDLERTIDIGVINKTFPSDGSPRFLQEVVNGQLKYVVEIYLAI